MKWKNLYIKWKQLPLPLTGKGSYFGDFYDVDIIDVDVIDVTITKIYFLITTFFAAPHESQALVCLSQARI